MGRVPLGVLFALLLGGPAVALAAGGRLVAAFAFPAVLVVSEIILLTLFLAADRPRPPWILRSPFVRAAATWIWLIGVWASLVCVLLRL